MAATFFGGLFNVGPGEELFSRLSVFRVRPHNNLRLETQSSTCTQPHSASIILIRHTLRLPLQRHCIVSGSRTLLQSIYVIVNHFTAPPTVAFQQKTSSTGLRALVTGSLRCSPQKLNEIGVHL